MNTTAVLDGILEREGPGTPPYQALNDRGGRTAWGISERAHPEAWRPGPPTKAQAREILVSYYVAPFQPLRGYLQDELFEAVVDDAVMSGASAAMKRLQWVLGMDMDGVAGPKTIEAVKVQNGPRLQRRYVVERAIRIARLVQHDPTQVTNLVGWITRVLSFLPVQG